MKDALLYVGFLMLVGVSFASIVKAIREKQYLLMGLWFTNLIYSATKFIILCVKFTGR